MEDREGATSALRDDRPSVLGSYIRAQRQLADLSLRQLATLSNVSNAYLSQVERGLHQPSLKVLRSIADALDISTEHMLSQAGVMSASARAFSNAAGGLSGHLQDAGYTFEKALPAGVLTGITLWGR